MPFLPALLGLTLGTVSQEATPSQAELLALSKQCGSEVKWQPDWSNAAKAARERDALILISFRSQAGFDLPDTLRTGPLMNPEIITLVNERFVVLEHRPGMAAPFVDPSVYGIGPLAFGASALIADVEGNILATTAVFGDSLFHEFLVRSLRGGALGIPPAEEGPAKGSSAKGNSAEKGAAKKSAIETKAIKSAQWHLRRGEWSAAAGLLVRVDTARGALLRARLLRFQRRGEEALVELRQAQRLAEQQTKPRHDRESSAELKAEVALEEAKVLTAMGRSHLALATLAEIPDNSRLAPAALYAMARLETSLAEHDAAFEKWRRLLHEQDGNRWSWSAAAVLLYEDFLRYSPAYPATWPSPQDIDLECPHEWSPLTPADAPRARRTGFDYLLGTQAADGSWKSGFVSPLESTRNPMKVGITSYAARALLPHLDTARARHSFERAVEFLRASRRQLRDKGEPLGIMDYFVWGKPSLLLFLADGIESGELEEEEWLPVMALLVKELQSKQREGGGWTYYRGNDVTSLQSRLEMSMSFVTAFVLHALYAADQIGVEVPQDMVERAVHCLKVCRNDDRSFEYVIQHAQEDAPRVMTPSGSAGRGPLCTLALYRWDGCSLSEVQIALKHFLQHREAFAREHGKTLMHCGPEGEGSHYLMFDYLYCAEAYAALKPSQRRSLRKPLLEQVLGARTAAGSFLDNPLVGEHFGTAAALLALDTLDGE